MGGYAFFQSRQLRISFWAKNCSLLGAYLLIGMWVESKLYNLPMTFFQQSEVGRLNYNQLICLTSGFIFPVKNPMGVVCVYLSLVT